MRFMYCLTVFQLNQEDRRVMMKSCAIEISLEIFLPTAGLEPGTARLAGQLLTF